ncbi:MAG: ribosome-associated translation inhibitor RaiA [Burkholderiaceae bacterium]
MQIEIQARDFPLTAALRDHVEKRLRFALSRFSDRVQRVAVRLSDVNGPRGGQDKNCHLHVRLRGLPDIVVRNTESDLYVAVDRASGRAGRALRRGMVRASAVFSRRSFARMQETEAAT